MRIVHSSTKFFRCVIMGPPGSGKGTVSERIVKNFHLKHLPCGDYLRNEIKRGTKNGHLAINFIKKGQLVPDDLVGNIIVSELENHKHKSILLDGFPRTVTQAKILESKISLDSVIELNVPFPIIVDRLKDRWIHHGSGRVYNLSFNPPKVKLYYPQAFFEGKDDVTGEDLVQREDDKPETVLARLETYKKWEEPLAKYYKDKNMLVRFSGNTTNEIWPHILEYLKSQMPHKSDT